MVVTRESWSVAARPGQVVAEDWQTLLSATHLPWAVSVAEDGSRVPFSAAVRRWWLDDLALVDCECGPCAGSRHRPQLAETDGEFVIVLITRAGTETVTQGRARAELRAGDAVAWDSTQPASFEVRAPLAKRSLIIPRAALDEVAGHSWLSGAVALNAAAPATRLLTAYLDTLSKALPLLPAGAVTAARNATLELLVGALRPDGTASAAETRPALRAVMERYIDQHLLDARLNPADIAEVHGVSVRTVQRVFSAGGLTVASAVRTRRLARARAELSTSNRPVATIAHRWGFADTSHFSRTFKAQYGVSPTDYRLTVHRTDGAHGHVIGAHVQGNSASASDTGSPAARS